METIPTHKKILPSKNSERGAMLFASQDSPALTSFFYYGTVLICFKFSLILSLHSAERVAVCKGFHFGNRYHIVIAFDRMF